MKMCLVLDRLPRGNGSLTIGTTLDRQCVTLLVIFVQNGRHMDERPHRINNTQLPIEGMSLKARLRNRRLVAGLDLAQGVQHCRQLARVGAPSPKIPSLQRPFTLHSVAVLGLNSVRADDNGRRAPHLVRPAE